MVQYFDMKKSKSRKSTKTIAVIGEGITEKYYLNSLSDSIVANIVPKLPKHTSILQLEKTIDNCIDLGYDNVYVLIDMDNKKEGKNKENYYRFKNKFHKKIKKQCYIEFFENERCLEIWFLYHFRNTTKEYRHSDDIVNELKVICGYDKNESFFRSSQGLHNFLCTNGGDFEQAKENARLSMISKQEQGREYTYSEMNKFFDHIPQKIN